MISIKFQDKVLKTEELEKKINYSFKKKELLIEALSHPSLKQEMHKKKFFENYERLELLGDSILNFIITEILFEKYLTYTEGQLAKIRSYLISKEVLCRIAQKLKLQNYIIMTFGEENLGGRNNMNTIENTMEAVIAAIYLDSDIQKIKKIIYSLWKNFFTISDITTYDPKSTLQELLQKNGFQKPIYKLIQKTGPAHAPIFTISITINNTINESARGFSIKEAEKNAARKIIKHFNNNPELLKS